MLEYLRQMKELSEAIDLACDESDMDRVVVLMKRRKELADRMGNVSPDDPDVKSGAVAEMLREIIERDGQVEVKIRSLMSSLQSAIQAVQGEKKIFRGYLKNSDEGDPKYLDKEG